MGYSGGSTSTPDEKHDSNSLRAGRDSEAGRSGFSGSDDCGEMNVMPQKILGKRKVEQILETPLINRLEPGVQHFIERNGFVIT